MPIRTSKTAHEYPYGHPRKPGEEFEVAAQDIPLMLALGRIEPGPDDKIPAPNGLGYITREMTAARAGKRTVLRKAA